MNFRCVASISDSVLNKVCWYNLHIIEFLEVVQICGYSFDINILANLQYLLKQFYVFLNKNITEKLWLNQFTRFCWAKFELGQFKTLRLLKQFLKWFEVFKHWNRLSVCIAKFLSGTKCLRIIAGHSNLNLFYQPINFSEWKKVLCM